MFRSPLESSIDFASSLVQCTGVTLGRTESVGGIIMKVRLGVYCF